MQNIHNAVYQLLDISGYQLDGHSMIGFEGDCCSFSLV